MKNKKIILTYIITVLLLALLFFGTLFFYDPLKLFHNHGEYKDYIQKNMREQAAGIINNWDFDSIILGTSMLENTSSKEASNLLGGNFVNLSLSGSNYSERKFVLDYALKKKKLKKVLYSLDYLGGFSKGGDITKWDYLYDDNRLNDFKAYINDRYLKWLFSFHTKKWIMGRKISLDRPNAWYKDKSNAIRFGGLDHWFKSRNHKEIRRAFSQILHATKEIKAGNMMVTDITKKLEMSKNYIDETLLSSVRKYPRTKFIFILPPYSRIKYAIWAQYDKSYFKRYKKSLKYLVSQTKKYKNIKVYGWGTEKFLDHISNYKDLRHYEYKINSWMLKAIKKQKGLLSMRNIDNYLKQISQKALHYDLLSLGTQIKNNLDLENNK